MEELARTDPRLWGAGGGGGCLMVKNVPITLSSIVARHAALSLTAIGPIWVEPPAQATTISSRPPPLSPAAATAAATWASSVTSQLIHITGPGPARPMSSAADR